MAHETLPLSTSTESVIDGDGTPVGVEGSPPGEPKAVCISNFRRTQHCGLVFKFFDLSQAPNG